MLTEIEVIKFSLSEKISSIAPFNKHFIEHNRNSIRPREYHLVDVKKRQ
jgi:hypothetical protein